MRFCNDKETGLIGMEPDTADEWLFSIWATGLGYDGETTVDGLKSLVDELVEMANKARDCLWDGALFGIHGSPDVDSRLSDFFGIAEPPKED